MGEGRKGSTDVTETVQSVVKQTQKQITNKPHRVGTSTQSCYNILSKMSSFQAKIIRRHAEKQKVYKKKKYDVNTGRKEKADNRKCL